MASLRYRNVTARLEKLKQELQAATGLNPVSTIPVGAFDVIQDGADLLVMLPDGAPAQTVNATVGAHDATTPSAGFTQAQTAYTRLSQAIANWGTLTAAQKDLALVSTMQVVRALLVSQWGAGTLGAAPPSPPTPEGKPARSEQTLGATPAPAPKKPRARAKPRTPRKRK